MIITYQNYKQQLGKKLHSKFTELASRARGPIILKNGVLRLANVDEY